MERLETEFLQDDYVVYKGVGVCRIECIETKSFDGVSSSEYLKLVPLSRNGSSYYVPMSFAGTKIRKPMTKEEIHSVIDSVPDTEILLTRDFRQRKSIIEAILNRPYKNCLSPHGTMPHQRKKGACFRRKHSQNGGKYNLPRVFLCAWNCSGGGRRLYRKKT